MNMTLREQEQLVNRITWGCCYACVKNTNNEPIYLIIKELTLKDKSWTDFIYQQAISRGKASELLSMRELAFFLNKQGLWTPRHDSELKELTDGLEKIDTRLSEDSISKHERKKTSRMRAAVEMAYRELSSEKESLFSSCFEKDAEHQRVKAIVYCSAYSLDETKYWPSWDIFQEESDMDLIQNIMSELINMQNVVTEQFRFIARSSHWRFKWLASKNCDDLFGKPVISLTKSQESLIYWSQVYDSVYESLDRPHEEIINDDEALDKWFEEQSKKRDREEISSGKKNKFSVSNNMRRHGEIGIVTNDALAGDIRRAHKLGQGAEHHYSPTTEEVNELNSPLSKKFKASQRRRLEKFKVLKEEDMRVDSNSRRVINSTDAVFKKQRRPDGFTGKHITNTYQGGTLQGRRG